jgi:hypothetical protein
VLHATHFKRRHPDRHLHPLALLLGQWHRRGSGHERLTRQALLLLPVVLLLLSVVPVLLPVVLCLSRR